MKTGIFSPASSFILESKATEQPCKSVFNFFTLACTQVAIKYFSYVSLSLTLTPYYYISQSQD